MGDRVMTLLPLKRSIILAHKSPNSRTDSIRSRDTQINAVARVISTGGGFVIIEIISDFR
jgi:hypothetical protein